MLVGDDQLDVLERAPGAGEEQLVAGADLLVGGGRHHVVVVVAIEVEHLAVERERAVGGRAQQALERDRLAAHQAAIQRRRARQVDALAADLRHPPAQVAGEAMQQRAAPLLVTVADLVEEGREQRRAEDRDAFVRDHPTRHHGDVRLEGLEERAIGFVVLAQDHEELLVELARRDRDRQVVHVRAGAAHDPGRLEHAGLVQGVGAGAVALHPAVDTVGLGVDVDDGDRHRLGVHGIHQQAAEAAVAADDPVAARRVAALLDVAAGQTREPAEELRGLGRVQRERERLAEALEGVEDVAGAEGGHVGRSRAALGAAQRRQARGEQAGGNRDREVGGVVVGERDHADAAGVGEAGELECLGVGGVCAQRRHVGRVVVQIELAELVLVHLDHDHTQPHAVERVADQAASFAVAAHQVEGLAQSPHRSHEALHRDRLAQAAVGEQVEHRAERVGPADHGQVDADDHPQPLLVGEGVGDLAETDRGRGVADEVEGVEEAEVAGLPIDDRAGHQGEPEHRDREQYDQQNQRRTHAPQDQQEDAVVAGEGLLHDSGLGATAFSGAA